MKELPSQHLDPRVKNVWRLNDLLGIIGLVLFVLLPVQLIRLVPELVPLANMLAAASAVLVAVLVVLLLIVLPPIRYARWRYEVTDTYLDIAKGIIWKKRYIIPFIRVQNTDTRQGPIMRLFGLASATVSTAAHGHEIPGLDVAVAEQLRDRTAELARIAREDV